MTPMNESIEKDDVTMPSVRPRAMMAKARLKEPSTNLATANGLLVLNGSALGRSIGWGCCCCCACWPLAGWAGVLKRAAAGFSGPAGWVLDGFSMVAEVSERDYASEITDWTIRYREMS